MNLMPGVLVRSIKQASSRDCFMVGSAVESCAISAGFMEQKPARAMIPGAGPAIGQYMTMPRCDMTILMGRTAKIPKSIHCPQCLISPRRIAEGKRPPGNFPCYLIDPLEGRCNTKRRRTPCPVFHPAPSPFRAIADDCVTGSKITLARGMPFSRTATMTPKSGRPAA